jgi:alpha-amylase
MSTARPRSHPSASLAEEGRRRVRPRLAPSRRARRAELPPHGEPIGAHNNGAPGDVLLQGFHWTSSSSQNPSWWTIVAQNAEAIRRAPFDAVWLPPPSQSVSDLGYLPTRWEVFDSAYGTEAELAAAIAAIAPARALADVVVNHRCGVATGGADFDDPPFAMADQTAAICGDDDSGVGTGALDTGEKQLAARDLDHTNAAVQSGVIDYLAALQKLGFQGFRFDEARGYAGRFLKIYNDAARPYLAVGEYWDGDPQAVIDWIDATRGSSMAFDFPTRTLLRDAIAARRFSSLKTPSGKPAGAIGLWPEMSVTFLENHDTDKDSSHPDEFGDGDGILQGYAYLLTHPGIPCVFWSHYFDYGAEIAARIAALVRIRKAQSLHRASVVDIVAADDGKYAAIVDDRVAMKLGPARWDPGAGWNVATDGNDYAVWTR